MRRSVRWTWTNWTFGVWWDRKRLHAGGIDIGPLEIVWRRSARHNARFDPQLLPPWMRRGPRP